MPDFAASLMDGKTAAVQPVTLSLAMAGLELRDAATGRVIGHWSLDGLQVERLGGGAVHLRQRKHPGALLTSDDAGLGLALRAQRVKGAHSHRPAVLPALVALLVVALGLGYLSLPAVSRWLARRVPLSVEEQLSDRRGSPLDEHLCKPRVVQAALDALTARLGSSLEGPGPRQVAVVNWPMVNAFTLPGGRVLVTRGLLDAAASPDELAGVLAHELEHVRRRHLMAGLIRGGLLSPAGGALVSDSSGFAAIGASHVTQLACQGFSRDDEREADAGALVRLAAAHVSPAGLAAFFERLAAGEGPTLTGISSHPDTAERLRALKSALQDPRLTADTTAALTDDQWSALKSACP